MLRFLLGRAGSGKTGRILEEIREYVDKGEGGLYLIVPEQYSHEAERILCRACGDALSLYGEVLSFSRLCVRVFTEMGGMGDRFIDEAGRVLVMSRALDTVSTGLKTGRSVSGSVEFISRLIETAKQMKNACITADMLRDASDRVSASLKDKLLDVANVLEVYWGLLSSDVKDPEDRLTRLAEILPDSSFGDGGHIWIDGFDDFTGQQYMVIEKLIEKDCDMTVCLTWDGSLDREHVFSKQRKAFSIISDMAKRRGTVCRIEHMGASMAGRPEELRFLEEHLFSADTPVFEGETERIKVISCRDPIEECQAAGAEILRLVRGGARFHDIAVAACDSEGYGSILDSVFEKYGIPVYRNVKNDILTMPPVLAVTSAIRVIMSGWDYDSVFSYLKTGYAPISREECDVLENYVIMWNIRGSMWYRDEDWSLSPEGYGGPVDEALLESINSARRLAAAPLVKLGKDMEKAVTDGERLKALYDFIEDTGIYDRIEDEAAELKGLSEPEAAARLMQLGEILTGAFEQYYSVAGDCECRLEEFLYRFELLLSKYDMGTIPTSVDSVVFGGIDRIGSREIKHLIVLGAVDGAIPKISPASGVFSDSECRQLISQNIDMPQNPDERLFGDISSVYKLFTQAKESVTVMYPSFGVSGSGTEPSGVVQSIEAMFSISPERADRDMLKTAAEIPCRELAASYREGKGGACRAAYEVFCGEPEFEELHRRVLKVLSKSAGVKLTPETARKLYGEKLSMTASRVDKFASCRFAYFMRYGLHAKPRTPAKFDASVIGTFMHYILENVTREVKARGGFKNVDDGICISLTEKYVGEFVRDSLLDMEDKSARFKYLFNVLTEDAVSIVLNMAEELRASDFQPIDFELDFSAAGELPPYEIGEDGVNLFVRGIVDRVDGWVHDGKLYVKVVDYKTGIKTFSLSDVWYGMGMQMLIYLFALQKLGRQKYGMEVVPAGVLYTPAREVILSQSRNISPEELKKERIKSMRRTGLLLNDGEVLAAMERGEEIKYLPLKITKDGKYAGDSIASLEQLGILTRHIDKTLASMGREILNGDIVTDPYFKNQVDNACRYCDFYHVCHYDEKEEQNPRWLKKLTTPEVWKLMEEEVRSDGET